MGHRRGACMGNGGFCYSGLCRLRYQCGHVVWYYECRSCQPAYRVQVFVWQGECCACLTSNNMINMFAFGVTGVNSQPSWNCRNKNQVKAIGYITNVFLLLFTVTISGQKSICVIGPEVFHFIWIMTRERSK